MATVASANTTAAAEGAITITKPTGLAENDILLAVLFCLTADSIATPSGWTAEAGLIGGGDIGIEMSILSKVADSSDVAASNFTFDVSDGVGSLGGVLMRITDGDIYNVIGNSDTDTTYSSSGTGTNPQFTVDVTPTYNNSVLLGIILSEDAYTFSGYTVNGTNPTWTNRFNGTLGGDTLEVFTATQATAAQVTTVDVTETPDHGTGIEMYFGLYEVRAQVDGSSSPAIITSNAQVLASSISTDTTVSQDAQIVSTSASAVDPTTTNYSKVWTPVSKS